MKKRLALAFIGCLIFIFYIILGSFNFFGAFIFAEGLFGWFFRIFYYYISFASWFILIFYFYELYSIGKRYNNKLLKTSSLITWLSLIILLIFLPFFVIFLGLLGLSSAPGPRNLEIILQFIGIFLQYFIYVLTTLLIFIGIGLIYLKERVKYSKLTGIFSIIFGSAMLYNLIIFTLIKFSSPSIRNLLFYLAFDYYLFSKILLLILNVLPFIFGALLIFNQIRENNKLEKGRTKR